MYFFTNIFASIVFFVLCVHLPALGQQSYNPNLGHFYMGRQQITIEDNSPIVNDKTGTANGGNGGLLNRPIALPKSGWQPYAPVESPGINANLPKVPGPVRQNNNSQSHSVAGKKGRTGNLAARGRGKPSANTVRSYSPYAQYPPPAQTKQAEQELGTSTHVKGSLLHWARQTPRQ